MDDIHARVPVNKLAVRVVLFKGEHFDPQKKVRIVESNLPLETRSIIRAMELSPNFTDLTNKIFGRFTVIGLAKEYKGCWVVRCSCGRYSIRRKSAITNPNNTGDRCEHCRHLSFLKKDEIFRRDGRNLNMLDL